MCGLGLKTVLANCESKRGSNMKSYSRAAKRANKKAQHDPFALAETPRKKSRGRKRMDEIRQERAEQNPHRTALEARARQMGHDPDKWQMMQFQALGEPAGQALFAAHTVEDAVGLWSVYAGLTNAEARYHRVCLGKSMAAKVAKVEFLPESFEINPEDEPDLRDEDEKHRSAANNWDRWLGWFNELGLAERSIIQSVSRGWTDPMIDGKLTAKGKEFVSAIEQLSKLVERAGK